MRKISLIMIIVSLVFLTQCKKSSQNKFEELILKFAKKVDLPMKDVNVKKIGKVGQNNEKDIALKIVKNSFTIKPNPITRYKLVKWADSTHLMTNMEKLAQDFFDAGFVKDDDILVEIEYDIENLPKFTAIGLMDKDHKPKFDPFLYYTTIGFEQPLITKQGSWTTTVETGWKNGFGMDVIRVEFTIRVLCDPDCTIRNPERRVEYTYCDPVTILPGFDVKCNSGEKVFTMANPHCQPSGYEECLSFIVMAEAVSGLAGVKFEVGGSGSVSYKGFTLHGKISVDESAFGCERSFERIGALCCERGNPYATYTTGGGSSGIGTTQYQDLFVTQHVAMYTPVNQQEDDDEETETCESEHPDIKECWDLELPEEYAYDSIEDALRALERVHRLPENSLSTYNETDATKGPCVGHGGKHWSVRERNGTNRGSIGGCPCCIDTEDGPEIEWKYRIFPA